MPIVRGCASGWRLSWCDKNILFDEIRGVTRTFLIKIVSECSIKVLKTCQKSSSKTTSPSDVSQCCAYYRSYIQLHLQQAPQSPRVIYCDRKHRKLFHSIKSNFSSRFINKWRRSKKRKGEDWAIDFQLSENVLKYNWLWLLCNNHFQNFQMLTCESHFFLTRAIKDISRNHFKPFFLKSV